MAENKEFIITRVFDAPQELVYKAWAEPAHLQKWFGPKGSEVKSFKQDFRVGGISHASMSAGGGPLMWSKWTYKAIEPISKLAWVQSFSDEKGGVIRHPMSATWPLEMLTTVLFEAEGKDKTKVTLKWLPINASAEEIDTFLKAFDGMNMGWGGTFERLDDHLAQFKNKEKTMSVELGQFEGKPHSKDLSFTRTFKAPRKLLFDIFTKPEHLVNWWAPKPFTMPKCDIDLRAGGKWSYIFRSPDGMSHDCEATYREVKAPEKLVMESSVPSPTGDPFFTIRQSITFRDKGNETELLLEVKVLQVKAGGEPFIEGMQQGFAMTLSNLDEYLAKGGTK